MNDFEKLVIEKLDKMDGKQDDMNGRLVAVETKIKIAIPFLSLLFTAGWSFIKVKVLGMKG